MSRTLTWEYLSPLHVNRCLNASDDSAVKKILLQADGDSGSNYFDICPTEEAKTIMVDLFYHLFRFGKSQNMTAEKISTLVSVMYHTHRDSISNMATMSDSYRTFEAYIISHSVHRPPYSAAIFAVDDVKAINDYVLQSYFRHYKLYFYTFTARSEASLKATLLGDRNEVPPPVPALAKSVPLSQWEATQAEIKHQESEAASRAAQEKAAEEAEADRKRREASEPPMSAGLKDQLDAIKTNVVGTSNDRLSDLEVKLVALEARVAEANKPPSAAAKAPPRGKK